MGVAASTSAAAAPAGSAGVGAGAAGQQSSGSSSLAEDQLYNQQQHARRVSQGEHDRSSSQHTHATMRSGSEWPEAAAPAAAGGGGHASLSRGWNRHSSGAHAGAAGERGSVDGGATR